MRVVFDRVIRDGDEDVIEHIEEHEECHLRQS